jgi:PPE-repeat protein
VAGNDLFVSNNSGGSIGEYTTSGATVNTSLILGLSTPYGVAIAGNDLFVANFGNDTIGEYTTSGGTVNPSLISGLNGPWALATVPVPEPTSWILDGLGLALLFCYFGANCLKSENREESIKLRQ